MRINSVIVLVLTMASHVYGQWEPDVRLTNDTSYSATSTNRASVQADGDLVHVVWTDSRSGTQNVYYKRSTDAGKSWGEDVQLGSGSGASFAPSIAIAGGTLHVVWIDTRSGTSHLYYKHSLDEGVSWSQDIELTPDAGRISGQDIVAKDGEVHILWCEHAAGKSAVCYSRSDDNGASWGIVTILTNDSTGSSYPQLAVSELRMYAVWENWRDVKSPEIFSRASSDGGQTWGTEMQYTDRYFSRRATAEASGSDLHFVWDDCSSGNFEVFYKRSSDEGRTWGTDTRLTAADGNSWWPSMAVTQSSIHICWEDSRNGNDEIFYLRSLDGGAHWSTDTLLVDNMGTMSKSPSIAVSGSVVHLVWTDKRDGPNGEIYYKRNPTGNIITDAGDVAPASQSSVLLQNFPNPFHNATTIRYSIPHEGHIRLTVHDLLGRMVAIVADARQTAGHHSMQFDSAQLPAGIYMCKIQTDGVAVISMMTVY